MVHSYFMTTDAVIETLKDGPLHIREVRGANELNLLARLSRQGKVAFRGGFYTLVRK